MQLTRETMVLYEEKAPELLEAVTSGEAEFIMKRDPATDYCVKFENGWCGVHATYGDAFLGDACHFFPRVTRQLGERRVMTASMACPEITRLVLLADAPAQHGEHTIERLPHSLKDYLPASMDAQQAWAAHEVCLGAVRQEGWSAERAVLVLNSVARSLDMMPQEQWAMALPFYLKMADGSLPAAEANPSDPFNILNALQGLVGAAGLSARPRLMETIQEMERVLDVTLDWETLGIALNERSGMQYLRARSFWKQSCEAHYAPLLKRWLEAQLSLALFPFSGFGQTLAERVTIIGVRMATVKLALMAGCFARQAVMDEAETVRAMQSIARFMDHLADATLSLKIYSETGWVREARMRALLDA